MAQTLNLARDNLDLCPLPSDVTLQLLPPDLYQSNVANLSSTDEDALHIFSDELTAMGGGRDGTQVGSLGHNGAVFKRAKNPQKWPCRVADQLHRK